MGSIAIRGAGSRIAVELLSMLPVDEKVIMVGRMADMPLDHDRYLFCAGVLYPRPRSQQTEEEIEESLRVNLWQVTDDIERIIAANARARICVIGSESGFTGSYDDTYAVAKNALHGRIESKRLKTPHQQLVCIAPSIIVDCGMTMRRNDHTNLMMRRATHPKQRFLRAIEVAKLVHHCLYVDQGYLSGIVIRMNGGSHAVGAR